MFELAKKKKKKIGENFERVRIKKKKRRKKEIKEINETMKKKKYDLAIFDDFPMLMKAEDHHNIHV